MLRFILHIDMDSYFATLEQQANPLLRNKPLIVSGKPSITSVVAAASKEAKRYGIKSGMTTWEAKKLCPQLIFVPGDPAKYQDATQRFLRILQIFSPTLEIFSIDEAFLDVTNTQERFGGAVKIAREIKRNIAEELGEIVTCSVGIGPNKMIAKLASKLDKPDGITVISLEGIPHLLKTTPLEEICGIGPRITLRLNELGIYTLEDLAAFSEMRLIQEFGIYGPQLKKMAQGIDDSPLLPYFEEPEEKSFGHSYSLPKEITAFPQIKAILLHLAEKVGRRMRQAGWAGKTVHLGIRTADFCFQGKQKSLPYPIDEGYQVYLRGLEILKGLKIRTRIQNIGISVSNLVRKNTLPLPLFPQDQKKEKITSACDIVNNKYGEFTIFRAKVLQARVTKEIAGYFGRSRRFKI